MSIILILLYCNSNWFLVHFLVIIFFYLSTSIIFIFWYSIGSLGKESVEVGVQNITVKTATFTGTENGVRIKSWARPSNGFAKNIRFQHCVMNNVQNPIVIDQNYCPGNENCPNQVHIFLKTY